MMFPLIINSYILVSFHQNLLKFVLIEEKSIAFLSQNIFSHFFVENSDFTAFVDLTKKFQP